MSRPDYGLDAPGLMRGMLLGGTLAATLALASAMLAIRHGWFAIVVAFASLAGFYLLGMGGYMFYGSRIAKVRDRGRLLDLVPIAADAVVLDVGCGRGLLLIEAARRASAGRAVGIDLWQAEDQSGNTPDATLANARLEGVAGRVEIHTGDMRRLPFADGTFDAVVSHWAVHNLYEQADRAVAIGEMARVLKAGGSVLIADIEHRAEYAGRLRTLGFTDVREIIDRVRTRVLGVLSFGSFQPAVVVGRKSTDADR